jgi:hypothetical protein
MEIDRVQYKEKISGDSKKKGVKCFNYRKKSYYMRYCHGNKKKHPKQQIYMMRYTRGNMEDEGKSLGIETIQATNYMDLKILLPGTISPIRLGQGVLFPQQAIR